MSIYDKASLVQIPSGVKSGTLYNVVPNTADGDFDFTRGSTATRVNKDGLIETVASGVPRLDYPLLDGVVQDCPALLLEPVRANKVPYSEDFSEWNVARATLEADAIISPDGGLTYKLKESTDTGSHPLYFQGITVSASLSHTMSIFVKAAGRSIFRINLTNGGSATYFDLNTEDVTSGTGKIENYGNGWYRCSTTFITSGTNQEVYIEPVISGTTQSYTGDGTSGIYVWGAQLEDNAGYVSSYIPTSGSAVTRSADVCNGAEADFNDSEGVLFAEISALADDSSYRFISINSGSSSNRVTIFYSNSSNSIRAIVTAGGIPQFDTTTTNYDVINNNKIALKYKSGDYALWINGTEINTATSGATPSGLNQIDLEYSLSGSNFYGKSKQVMTFNEALSDTELENLTSWDSFREMATEQLYTTE